MEPFVKRAETYYEIDEWTSLYKGLVAGFSTKHGGNSKGPFESLNLGFHVNDDLLDVRENRQIVSAKLDFPLNNWVGAEQTHQTLIKKITKADRGKGAYSYEDGFKKTDGFYTSESGILLTLCYADCVPLFFIAPEKRLVGTAHAGWRGSVAEIAPEMIETWKRENVDPSEVLVAIGPSICENCYVVDDYVISHLQNKLEGVGKKTYNLIRENQYQLNLQELNKQFLIAAGVKEEHILMTRLCTSCSHEDFFSHRKDNGKTGRMIGFIGWKED